MPRCIFCLEDLDITPGAKHAKIPSEEHIIPNALGGSRDFSTMDVCFYCNSKLGETVDSDFINSPIIIMFRHQFKTKGYSGTIPDIELATRSMDNNEPGKVILRADATASVRHAPTVIRDKKSDHEVILVGGHPEDVSQIFKGIIRKSLRQATPEQLAVAMDTLDQSLADAIPEINEVYNISIDCGPAIYSIHTSLIKIAYEFCHLLFGWTWTDAPEAIVLRAIAQGQGSHAQIDSVLQGIGIGFRAKLPLPKTALADHHVVAFLPGQPSMIFVSLFGDQLLTVCVKIEADLSQIYDTMDPGTGMMVSIDAATRKTTWVSIIEFFTHMQALQS